MGSKVAAKRNKGQACFSMESNLAIIALSRLSSLLRHPWIVSVILIFGLDQGIGAIDGLDGTERKYQELCLGEILMGEPLSPDRVFDFPMDEPEPHPAYDFFAPGPLPGYAGNPNNNNGWIEADVPLLGELGVVADEPMVSPLVDEIVESIVEVEEQVIALVIDIEEDIAMLFGDGDFSDDDSEGLENKEEVWEVNEEWLMAPITPPPMPVLPPPSTYEVGGSSTTAAEGQSFTLPTLGFPVPPSVIEDLITRMGKYGHGQLVKKVIQVSDAEVADGYDVLDGSGRGQIRAGWCSGGVGSANCNPERRGDYRIDLAGAGITGRCAAERFADSVAVDYGF
ncbi:hypothetical protein Tco_0010707 [Tanacetum coccineum]